MLCARPPPKAMLSLVSIGSDQIEFGSESASEFECDSESDFGVVAFGSNFEFCFALSEVQLRFRRAPNESNRMRSLKFNALRPNGRTARSQRSAQGSGRNELLVCVCVSKRPLDWLK